MNNSERTSTHGNKARTTFSRAAVTIILILIELLWILSLINWLSPYIGWIESIIRLLALLIVFSIVDHSTRLSADLMWVIVITVLPVPGTIIYLFLSVLGQFGNKTFRGIISETEKAKKGQLKSEVPV